VNALDHYAAVLADLEAQRQRIDIAIGAIKALRPATSGGTLHIIGIESDDEATPPPFVPPLKRVLPDDPQAAMATVTQLFDHGFSQNEIAAMYGTTGAHIDKVFRGEA